MVWFTGERPLSVYARGNRISTQGTDFRYHDYVAATLSYPSGLVGRITANFGCVHRHQHVLRVFGTKATFINDDAGPRLHMTRDPATMASAITLPTLPESKGSLIPSFVSAILNDQNLEAHAQEIFDVISICVACEEALKSNSEVEVQYV
jgi:predicted dehydrogenase